MGKINELLSHWQIQYQLLRKQYKLVAKIKRFADHTAQIACYYFVGIIGKKRRQNVKF